MIPVKYEIRDRGPTPRGMRKVMRAATAAAWFEAAVHFHATMSDARFTHAHATKAGYAKRSPKYEREKLHRFGHTYPLVFTGDTRRRVRTASITSTSNGASVRYPGARKLNFRRWPSSPSMVLEFTNVLPEEANELAQVFDKKLDQELNAYSGDNK